MSNRYHTLHENLNAAGAHAYMPYAMLGYPTVEESFNVCRALIESGAHGLELGLPFSDPLADGPVIQAAGNKALDNGFKTEHALEVIRRVREIAPNAPLTLMTYYNMVNVKGVENFIRDFAEAGIDGILIPDISTEAAAEVAPLTKKYGVCNIMLASPLSNASRLKKIAPVAEGFVYAVTRLGVTGAVEDYSAQLNHMFTNIRAHINLPIFAGFGVSTPEQAQKMVQAGADGAITGSQVIKLIDEGNGNLSALSQHTRFMVEALSK